MLDDFIYGLIMVTLSAYVIFVVSGWLLLIWWRKRRGNGRYERRPQRQWPGHGMDVSGIAGRVREVRTDPVAALDSRFRGLHHRETFQARTRRALRRLPFFRNNFPESGAPQDSEP